MPFDTSFETHHAHACSQLVNGEEVSGLWTLRVVELQPLEGVSLGALHFLYNSCRRVQQIDPRGIQLR